MNAIEDLYLRIIKLVLEIHVFLMKFLINLIHLNRWSFSSVINPLPACTKVSLLDILLRVELASEVTEFFVFMPSDSDKAIIVIEDNGESIDISEVAVVLVAREGLDRIIMVGECACEFNQREIMVRYIYLQQLDIVHEGSMVDYHS